MRFLVFISQGRPDGRSLFYAPWAGIRRSALLLAHNLYTGQSDFNFFSRGKIMITAPLPRVLSQAELRRNEVLRLCNWCPGSEGLRGKMGSNWRNGIALPFGTNQIGLLTPKGLRACVLRKSKSFSRL